MKVITILMSVVMALTTFETVANHVLGGNITYECLGGNSYQITLHVYKDCFGSTAAPITETLFFIPDGCSLPFSANLAFQSVTEISDLCDTELANSSCNGGFIPGAELVVYTGVVTLDPDCSWSLQWAAGDWNYFNNMDNSTLPTAYVNTIIDPTVVGCVDSVVPSSPLPVGYACTGDAVVYDLAISNPNNYDLTYTLICPQTTGGADAPMLNACDEPIPGISLDPITGQIDFTAPMMFGNYIVAVEIEMFDNGNYVGTIIESIAFTIRLCALTPTVFEDPLLTLADNSEGNIVSADEVSACIGDSVCVEVVASNSNIFRTITLSSDFEVLFPGGTFDQTGINPATGTFCFVADETMIGSTVVTVDAEDDTCPIPNEIQTTFTITVNPGALLSISDTTICFGESIELTALGDVAFDWSVIDGDNSIVFNGNDPVQTISPQFDTQIEITALNGDPACNISDSALISVSLSDLEFDLIDESCAGNDGSIELTVTGGSGNYTYDWPDIPSDVPNPGQLEGGDYTVIVEDVGLTAGCTRTETVTLDSTPAPEGSIAGEVTLCEGECTDITFSFSGIGPFTVNLLNETTGLLETTPALNDGDTFEVCPTETTTYTLELVTDANVPACTYDLPSSVTITVRPEITAGFLVPDAICDGETAELTLSISEAGAYDITYTPIGGIPASPLTASDGDVISFTTAAAGDYEVTSVQYTDAPQCAGQLLDPVTLVVNDLPTATIDDAFTICAEDFVSIEIELTGTGPWLLEHDYIAEPSPLVVGASPFTWNLIDPIEVNTTINYTSVTDQGTGCSADLTESTVITVNPLPTGNILSDATLCFDESFDLAFTLTGSGPFDIEWSEDGVLTSEIGVGDGFTVEVNPDVTTEYCLESITDSNSCSSNPASCITLTVIDAATSSFDGGTAEICEGECVDVAFDFQNGLGPWEVTLEISGNSGTSQESFIINTGETFEICPDEATTLTLIEVVDTDTDCSTDLSAAADFEITISEIPTASLSGDADICEGACADLEVLFENVTGPLNFTVDGVDYVGIDPATDMVNGIFTIEVCPVLTTNYVLTAFEDLGNACAVIGDDAATVAVYAVPDAAFEGGFLLCEGESGSLVFEITASGAVDLEIEVDAGGNLSTINLIGILDTDTFEVTPDVTTTYTILTVTDAASPAGCFSEPNEAAVVTVNTAPLVSQIDTLCALTSLTYEFAFVISGGDPATYSVSLPGTFEDFNGGPDQLFTSDPLVPQDGAVFVIDDQFGCAPTTITLDPFECPSVTFAGTVDTEPLVICDSGTITSIHNGDEILDPNDVLSFIIHSSATTDLGVVYYISDIPIWDIETDLDFGGVLQYGTTYYLSAVAGDDDGSGVVDLGAPVLDISIGMPFTVLETPSATLTGDATLCEGETTLLTITFAGSGPYTVAWDIDGFPAAGSPVVQTEENPLEIEVSEAGVYTLASVSNDVCDGIVDGTATVVVNPLPTATLSGGGNLCAGETAQLEIEFEGSPDWDVTIGQDTDGDGVADNTFNVSYGATPAIFDVTETGEWFVIEVADATTCLNDAQGDLIEVIVVPLPEVTFITGDTVFCAGASVDVEIELTGEAPWTLEYGVGGVPFNEVITESPYIFTVDTPGSVCMSIVTDANGCEAALGDCIEVDELPVPVADPGPDLFLCVGEVATLGTPSIDGYQFTWTPGIELDATDIAQPVFTAPDINVTTQYTYTLLVEAGGCSDEDEITVTVNPLPIVDAGDEAFICQGDEIELLASGGTSYQWTDDGTFVQGVDSANPIVAPVGTTTYEVEVFDLNNCSAIATVVVNVADPISAQVAATLGICFGTCDGEIDVIAAGGYGNYSIEWDLIADDTFTVDELCEGTYTFTIEDENGCTYQESVEIEELDEYTINGIAVTDTPCFESSEGSIEVDSPEAILFTLVPNDVSNATGIFNDLTAGSYTITATDQFGCSAEVSAEIIELSAPMTLEVGFESIEVCLNESVDFTALAGGGDGDFTYEWFTSEPPGAPVSNDNPYTVVVSDEMTLFVQAVDGNGCVSEVLTSEAFFTDPIVLELLTDGDAEICFEECFDLEVSASGGTGNYTYEWTSSASGQNIIGNGPSLNDCPIAVGLITYVLTVNDGCVSPQSVNASLNVLPIPEPLFAIDVTEGCFPVTVTFENLTDTLMSAFCEWDFGDGNLAAVCTDIVYTYSIPGSYTPSLSVTADNGCSVTLDFDGTVDVYDYPVADFTWEPDPINTLETTARFINLSSEDAILFDWNFVGVGQSDEVNPVIDFPAIDGSSWLTCLRVENEFGCPDSICYDVNMESVVLVYVPNAFSPDGDGLNELFMPAIGGGVSTQDYLFQVWDRWGDKVFETNRIGEGWNGSYQRGSYYVQVDAYVWILEYRELDSGNVRKLRGSVTVIR